MGERERHRVALLRVVASGVLCDDKQGKAAPSFEPGPIDARRSGTGEGLTADVRAADRVGDAPRVIGGGVPSEFLCRIWGRLRVRE